MAYDPGGEVRPAQALAHARGVRRFDRLVAGEMKRCQVGRQAGKRFE